jgi:iron(III) transport system substrate-binding protein
MLSCVTRGVSRLLIALELAVGSTLVQLPARAQTDIAALAGYEGADRTERLIAGAKRERELMLYGSMQPESLALLQKGFEAKYGVKIRLWRGAGAGILQRMTMEAKATRFAADVIESDGFALEALHREKLLQAARSPFAAELVPEALRSHGEWIGTRVNISASVYNTALFKKDALPSSYPDLLHPRWRGILGIEADDYDWFGMVVTLLGEEKGLKLFRDIITSNGISVRKGHTHLTNLTAAGEVGIGLDVFMQNVDVAKKNGAPVDWFLISPAVGRFNGVGLARRAPHPNAALLFYDFMLSDGQEIMLRREFVPSSRKIPSVLSRISLNFVDPSLVLDQGEKWQRLFAEVVKNGGR